MRHLQYLCQRLRLGSNRDPGELLCVIGNAFPDGIPLLLHVRPVFPIGIVIAARAPTNKMNHRDLAGVVPSVSRVNGVTPMEDDRTLKDERDRSLINLGQDYEVRYWTQKFGVTGADLRDAIKKVGNSAEAVEKELAG